MTEPARTTEQAPSSARQWYYASLATAVASGAVAAAMLVVLFANRFSVGVLDVKDSVELQRRQEQLREQPGSEQRAEAVKQYDYQLRRDYFAGQFLARNAKGLLVVSFAVFLVSVNGALFSRQRLPRPGAAADAEAALIRENMMGRWAVAAGAVIAVAAGVVAAVLVLPGTREAVTVPERAGGAEGAGSQPAATPPAATRPAPGFQPPAPEEIARHWPYFRGPTGMGVCTFPDIPDDWGEQKNVLWKVPVPLKGASSPVVWGRRLFITAADQQRRQVLCYDAETGDLLWTRDCSDTGAKSDLTMIHADFVLAAATSVTDGAHVVSAFANGDVVCFDVGGRELWARSLGDTSKNAYGWSSSLAMHGSKVLALFDTEEGYLVALDVRGGRELWRQKREDTTWCSPVVAQTPGGPRVLVSASPFISAWDAETGRRVWWVDVLDGDIAPTPIYAGGLVLAAYSESGLFAIRPGGSGDVTESHLAWEIAPYTLQNASFPETASPVSDGKYVYGLNDKYLTCVDITTGKVVYEQDIGAASSFASPSLAGGKLYVIAGGTTCIIAPGPTYRLIRKCRLEDRFMASPAFLPGRVFLRGEKHLYGIGAKK